MRFTYSEAIKRSRAESAMFRSFANSCKVRFSFLGATNLTRTSLMFFLLSLWDICGTKLRPYLELNTLMGAMSRGK